jgi:hypothetical protein
MSPLLLQGAVNFVLLNGDPAGVGFNDPTPAAPVGGNPGVTIGQQRINVFIRAAQIWGAELNSPVDVRVFASWPADLPCSATGAVLGAAGPTFIVADTPGTLPNYWYPAALGDKLNGANISGPGLPPNTPDIVAFFNPDLGKPGCLPGVPFYLGIDGNTPPGTIDLLETLVHEIGHGLGFLTVTDETTGAFCCGPGGPFLPSIFDRFLLDKNIGLHWDAMSNAQRMASAINNAGNLVFDGPLVVGAAPGVLGPAAEVRVTAPASAVATYIAGPSMFGPSLAAPVLAELMPVTGGGGLACAPLSPLDAAAVAGKIALIARGTCAFTAKVKNAQNAGALGVIISNNLPGAPPNNLNGIDPTIVIPSAQVTLADGNALRNRLLHRSRTNSGVFVRLGNSATLRAGADALNRVVMYAPNPVQPGSSISHYDVSAFPNLLMEPFDTPDTDLSVKPPGDLTLPALNQLGW